jgi:HEPN domain-containing protein
MSAPPDLLREKVRQWLVYGDEDLRLAEGALEVLEECPYRLVAYHAQQCAEKHLKAYLLFRRVDFPFTHNISLLLELCAEWNDWQAQLESTERLTQYAISTRYPGVASDVSLEEAREAVELARQVRAKVRQALADVDLD